MNLNWEKAANIADSTRQLLTTHFEKFAHTVTLVAETDSEYSYRISANKEQITLSYSSTPALLHGLTHLASMEDVISTQSKALFATRGIMFDMSRGGALTIKACKQYIFQLALCGFNMVMLYIEDLYVIEGEPYWGYMRGAYSAQDLKELDDYAHALGVELIASIQTLGHLEEVLRWPGYRELRDTSNVILCGDEKTYALLDKAINSINQSLRSRRIHIGMDEAWGMGKGAYLDKTGDVGGFDMFNQHLKRVVEIAENYGLKPEIWSDMYVRMGSEKHEYYDKNARIPQEVQQQVPPNLLLWYWDYYHNDAETYDTMLKKHHQEISPNVAMASGVWTWNRLTYDHETTLSTTIPSVAASLANGLSEILFTSWNDDGAICDYDSAFAGYVFTGNQLFEYSTEKPTEQAIFAVVFDGASYDAKILSSQLNHPLQLITPDNPHRLSNFAITLLWDDPLLGLFYNSVAVDTTTPSWQEIAVHYHQLADKLSAYKDDRRGGDTLYVYQMCCFLAQKVALQNGLRQAYQDKDKAALTEEYNKIKALQEQLACVQILYREQWYRSYKPFGFEVTQGRFAALKERFYELEMRLSDYLNGKLDIIAEWEETVPQTPASYHLAQQVNRSYSEYWTL